jgi:hypothetical protein
VALRTTHVSSETKIVLEDQENLFAQGPLNERHRRCGGGVVACRAQEPRPSRNCELPSDVWRIPAWGNDR